MVVPRKHRTVVENTHPCGICKLNPFKYICPRCNLRYCSLACYKDKSHVQCTESFYKSSVMNELQSSPTATPQDRKKMLGILDRFEQRAIDEEQLLELSDQDLLLRAKQSHGHSGHSDSLDQNNRLSAERLGSLNSSGAASTRKLTPQERDELIRRAVEDENAANNIDEQIDPEDRKELEHMLELEYQDFVSRFADVNLDQESFDGIWARLNPEEQQEFREKFLLSGRTDYEDQDVEDFSKMTGHGGQHSDIEDEEEELEAKKLLQDMGETLKRSGERVGDTKNKEPMLADLDPDDLKAIRDAEISELIPVWRPWWEVEAEEAGQLKKVVVTKVQDTEDSERLGVAAAIIETDMATSQPQSSRDNIPINQEEKSGTSSDTVLEKFVLDEEAMLKSHKVLVRSVDEAEQEEKMLQEARNTLTVPPMTKAPHPSLIYHIGGLLFAYAATCRVLNGDLMEEPEQTLYYIFDLCLFFAPPQSSTSPAASSSALASEQLPEVDDFETTLAVLQRCSLDSKLWKGDTLRLDMLSLLLRDLTLILARPSRCLRCIQDLRDVFAQLQAPSKQRQRRQGIFSKPTLHRLCKKLEFYESYLLSEEWLLNSDIMDRVRTEVVMTGIRVRQEMIGWSKELENVSRLQSGLRLDADTDMNKGSTMENSRSASSPVGKVLIEELS
ncbi:hypothetical protein BGX28_003087 [Mortierella sp. GBA30]|nr:hypothetical protein BGX28_003087 [Mortierella sp. GBA30]